MPGTGYPEEKNGKDLIMEGGFKRTTLCPNTRLRAARMERGWSQSALADLLGTCKLTVGRWERGERSPQLFYRSRLCEIFDLSAAELGLVQEKNQEETRSIEKRSASASQLAEAPLSSVLAHQGYIPKKERHMRVWLLFTGFALLLLFGGKISPKHERHFFGGVH